MDAPYVVFHGSRLCAWLMRRAYNEMLQGCIDHPDQWEFYTIWMIELHDGLHIDYYPTNFVVSDDLLWYIDYECNNYIEQWDFEHWGKQYWR